MCNAPKKLLHHYKKDFEPILHKLLASCKIYQTETNIITFLLVKEKFYIFSRSSGGWL